MKTRRGLFPKPDINEADTILRVSNLPVNIRCVDHGRFLPFFIYFITFVVMDSQFWFYIIVLIVVFLSRVLKKQKPGTETDEPERPSQPSGRQVERPVTDRPKPLTFEELLREITEQKESARPVQQQAAPKPVAERGEVVDYEVVDYDENIPEEEKDLEVIEPEYSEKTRFNEQYESAKREAFIRPSLEETMNVKDTVVEYRKFRAFDQKEQRNLLYEYTKDLQDPEGLKKAFVLTEILN
ncbi:MAG TPA: hypothetical protein VEB86_06845, partial [Chryseosolibacter sp.]|nr:hypothetical protein [Chryseosolibacter sp.]